MQHILLIAAVHQLRQHTELTELNALTMQMKQQGYSPMPNTWKCSRACV